MSKTLMKLGLSSTLSTELSCRVMGVQYEDVQDEMNAWFRDNLPIARALHSAADHICNSTARRLIRMFVNFNLPPIAAHQHVNRLLIDITTHATDN